MTDRPILFSGPMVRAILDGRKTQTRRCGEKAFLRGGIMEWNGHEFQPIPAYAPGDELWVCESCMTWEGLCRDVVYRADETKHDWEDLCHDARHGAAWKRHASTHMPRWASRITLTVTDVRVQRVQDISEADAKAEGFDGHPDPIGALALLWDDLNADRGYGWGANPWVVALTFSAEQRNIDA